MDPATEMFKSSEVLNNSMGDQSEQYARVSEMISYLSLYVQRHPGEKHTQLQLNNIIQKNPYIDNVSLSSLTKLYGRITEKETGELQSELITNNPNSIIADLETVMNSYNSKEISVDDASRQRIELKDRFYKAILNQYFSEVDGLQKQYCAGKMSPAKINEKREDLQDSIATSANRFSVIHDNLETMCDEEREFSRK